MKLLSQYQLEQSAVVANNRMNRERNAAGINSYERDIKLSPIEFLTDIAREQKSVAWLDICCGKGKALIQTARYLETSFPGHDLCLVGIDLADIYDPVPPERRSVSLVTGSFLDYSTDLRFDLITCVHGLHYIGDKMAAIKKAAALLKPEGTLVANLDINNFKNSGDAGFYKKVYAWLHSIGFKYNSRSHLLHMEGAKYFEIPFQYLGADDTAGPNYTGMEVVNSYYK